jgi:hypothetical protein
MTYTYVTFSDIDDKQYTIKLDNIYLIYQPETDDEIEGWFIQSILGLGVGDLDDGIEIDDKVYKAILNLLDNRVEV